MGETPSRWEGGGNGCGILDCEKAVKEAADEDYKVLGWGCGGVSCMLEGYEAGGLRDVLIRMFDPSKDIKPSIQGTLA